MRCDVDVRKELYGNVVLVWFFIFRYFVFRKKANVLFNSLVGLPYIQGQIYDKLYSMAALRTTYSECTRYAQQLIIAMEQWHVELQQVQGTYLFVRQLLAPVQIDPSLVNNRQIFDITRDSWDIMYYSTFTSLLRAPTASEAEEAEVSSQCFQVARLALEGHLRCFSKYQTSDFLSDADYANC